MAVVKGLPHAVSERLAELFAATEAWHEQANCRGLDPGLFFPERGGTWESVHAKAVCAECVVRQECLEYAVRAGERYGIFGGLSEKERRRIRVTRRMGGAA